MSGNTLIFAHRGSAGTHPENTMAAFEAAVKAGAEGLEIDIHLTKDGVPVVIHDDTVDRTTNGTGRVKDYTLEELKKLDAGSWFNANFEGAVIPTLEEVLHWMSPTSLLLNIELKSGVVRYEGIEQKALDLVRKYDLMERVIFSSFNHYSLVEIKRLEPSADTAILFMEGIYEPWDYAKRIGASGLHCFLPVAVPELFQGAAQAGMPVRPFPVNKDEHMAGLIKAGCAAIITDWPDKAMQIRQSLSGE